MDPLTELSGDLHHGEVIVQGAGVEVGMEAEAPDLQCLGLTIRGHEAGAANQDPAMQWKVNLTEEQGQASAHL